MAKVFRQVEKDGETTYEEVEIAEIITAEDVPDEVVKSHPTFQATDKQRQENLAESIERRKKIAEIEASRNDEVEPEPDVEPEPAPSGEQHSPDELIAMALEAFDQRAEAAKNLAQSRKEKLNAALKEYNLPPGAASAFEFIQDDKFGEAAKRLSAAGLTFPDGGGGDGNVDDPIKEGLAGLDSEFDEIFGFEAGDKQSFSK